jgi:hypothetical protein
MRRLLLIRSLGRRSGPASAGPGGHPAPSCPPGRPAVRAGPGPAPAVRQRDGIPPRPAGQTPTGRDRPPGCRTAGPVVCWCRMNASQGSLPPGPRPAVDEGPAALVAALEEAPSALWFVTGPEQRTVWANARARTLWPAPDDLPVVGGRPVADLVADVLRTGQPVVLTGALDGGGPPVTVAVRPLAAAPARAPCSSSRGSGARVSGARVSGARVSGWPEAGTPPTAPVPSPPLRWVGGRAGRRRRRRGTALPAPPVAAPAARRPPVGQLPPRHLGPVGRRRLVRRGAPWGAAASPW